MSKEYEETKSTDYSSIIESLNKAFKGNSVKLPTSFSRRPASTKELESTLEKHGKDIEIHWKYLKLLIWFVIWLISILIINMIWWFYESYYRLNKLENDYIEKTILIDEKIRLFEKDIEYLNEKYTIQSDIVNKEIDGIDQKVAKETETQLNKKIIEFNFKILNNNIWGQK